MNILITGAKGQLGAELMKCLTAGKTEIGHVPAELAGCEFLGIDVAELDIAKLDAVVEVFSKNTFDAVINCAAMTNVDGCEKEVDTAFAVNALGPRNLAIACEKTGAKLVHISTDYVFAGNDPSPRREWDAPNPQSIYGKSKLLGEQYVREFCKKYFIVRTAWLYGYAGNNFVKTIIKNAREKGELKVVHDQRGNPTNAADLAHHLLKLVPTGEYGIYHATGSGECSWYDFACKIVEYAKIPAKVIPCTTSEFPRPAKRPEYSSLDNMALRNTVGDEFREWQDALKCFFENFKE